MQHSEPGSELITMGTLFEIFGIIYQKKLYQDKADDTKSSRKMMQLKPVLEYIDSNYYRIERACSELSTSDLTLAEVAYRCGFSDVSYFIKTFKRYKGITPHRYCLNIG